MGMGWKGKDMKAEGDWLGETKKNLRKWPRTREANRCDQYDQSILHICMNML